MQLPSPKELRALLKVCRDFGVETVEFGEIKVKFGDMPQEAGVIATEMGTAMPNDEELAYWSTQPDPLQMRREAENENKAS